MGFFWRTPSQPEQPAEQSMRIEGAVTCEQCDRIFPTSDHGRCPICGTIVLAVRTTLKAARRYATQQLDTHRARQQRVRLVRGRENPLATLTEFRVN